MALGVKGLLFCLKTKSFQFKSLSLQALHALAMKTWVFPKYLGFLPQSKDFNWSAATFGFEEDRIVNKIMLQYIIKSSVQQRKPIFSTLKIKKRECPFVKVIL